MRDVRRYCLKYGDEPVVLAITPSGEDLSVRIMQKYDSRELSQKLVEAKKFFDSPLPDGTFLVKPSVPKEEMFCELLKTLSCVLTVPEGRDVAVSYAGTKINVATSIQDSLGRSRIMSFVAGVNLTSSRNPLKQKNIDRVFRLVDLILVVWSKAYSAREFTAHEWKTSVVPAWNCNPNRVLFVVTDKTDLPPEMRGASKIILDCRGARPIVGCS